MRVIFLAFVLVFSCVGCSSPSNNNQKKNLIEESILDYLKKIANDPNSIELIEYKLIQKQRISDCYNSITEMSFLSDEEKDQLLKKFIQLKNDTTTVSFCYEVDFRGNNKLGALVKNKIFVLYDDSKQVITHGNGLMTLNYNQMRELLEKKSSN